MLNEDFYDFSLCLMCINFYSFATSLKKLRFSGVFETKGFDVREVDLILDVNSCFACLLVDVCVGDRG